MEHPILPKKFNFQFQWSSGAFILAGHLLLFLWLHHYALSNENVGSTEPNFNPIPPLALQPVLKAPAVGFTLLAPTLSSPKVPNLTLGKYLSPLAESLTFNRRRKGVVAKESRTPAVMVQKPTEQGKGSGKSIRILELLKKLRRTALPQRDLGFEEQPQVVEKILPVYPTTAREKGLEGTVKLQVEILPNGDAGAVKILTSNGTSEMDLQAMRAVSQWRFKPRMINGVARPSRANLAIKFGLKG